MRTRNEMTGPWLPERLRPWVDEHIDVLEYVYEAFARDQRWPDPGELQRHLVARGTRLPITSLIDAMPRELGWRSFSPNQVRLTIFALGCVPAAQPLLEHYVALIRLALARYEDVAEPATVSRSLAVSCLGLDEREVNMLSQLVLDDHPFFGSSVSSADIADWEFSVEDRILQFDEIATTDQLLVLLAGWRLSPPRANPLVAPAPVVTGQLGRPEAAGPSVGDAAVAAATLVGFAVLVLSGLAPWLAAASAAVVGAAVLMRHHLSRPGSRVLSWAGLALVAVVAGFAAQGVRRTFFDDEAAHPHRYFVRDVVVRRSVSPAGTQLLSGPLGPEDEVLVTCLTEVRGKRWAKLDDGTWVPLSTLQPEVLAGAPSAC